MLLSVSALASLPLLIGHIFKNLLSNPAIRKRKLILNGPEYIKWIVMLVMRVKGGYIDVLAVVWSHINASKVLQTQDPGSTFGSLECRMWNTKENTQTLESTMPLKKREVYSQSEYSAHIKYGQEAKNQKWCNIY